MNFESWANDHVWSVTARMYCSCGEALHTTAAWLTVVQNVGDFWASHEGPGHGPCTPEIARRARMAHSRLPVPGEEAPCTA